MDDVYLTPIELYMKKSLRILIIMTILCGLAASITFTILKLLGFYPSVSWVKLIIFDISDVTYCFFGHIMYRRCIAKDGTFRKKDFKRSKLIIALLIFVQWNYITYMIPSRDFWAYASLFALLSLFYLDHKYVLLVEGEIGVSMIIAWIILGDQFAPVQNEYYYANVVLRIVLIVLLFILLWFIAYVLETLLVKQVENIADYDTLTGLRNRRTLYKTIEDQIKKKSLFANG